MKIISLCLATAGLAVFLAVQPAAAQKRRSLVRPPVRIGAVVDSPEKQRRMETFLKVWTTLGENYFDPNFNNLNWIKIKSEFEPRVRLTKTDAELHKLLTDMIRRLGVSHLSIISPEVYRAIESAKIEAKARELERTKKLQAAPGVLPDEDEEDEADLDDPLAEYGLGLDLRLLDDQFVITRLDTNSAAQYAGLKTGYIIEKVNGVSLADMVKRIEMLNPDAKNIKRYLPSQVNSWFLNGEKDSYVAVTYLDETNVAKEIKIRREKIKSETIQLSRNIPERQLKFETSELPNDVGYIRFNYFALPVIDKFCNAVGQFKDKKAIVVDLRGNFGGVLATMVGLGGMLTETSIDLGTSIYKTGSERLLAESKPKNFKGKLVFLVDNQTVSAAEIFASSLQDSGRALIVGNKTAGEALPSVAVDLPTGAVMQYPIANYRSSSGKYLEGIGLTPDLTATLSRESLLKGSDTQLDIALQAIKEGTTAPKPEPEKITVMGDRDFSAVPPPPVPKTPPKKLGEVTINVPPIAAPKEGPKTKDAASLRVIDAFLTEIGGAEKISKLTSYEIHGETELLVKGTKNEFELSIYRDGKDKYAEIMRSVVSGEIREIYNGEQHFVQTDYGTTKDLGKFSDVVDTDILSSIRTLTDPKFFVSYRHQGVFEREGRKVHLIDAMSKDGMYVALAFDVQTKLLVSFTGAYYGMSFADYRPVGALKLPFRIERERIMHIDVGEYKVGEKIDPATFAKKPLCFDTVE